MNRLLLRTGGAATAALARSRAHLLLVMVAAAACSSTGGEAQNDEASIKSVAQPIINGWTLAPGSAELASAINVTDGFYNLSCSGVALDNQWVMTAQHCTYGMNYNGAVDQVGRASIPSEIRNVAEVRREPGGTQGQFDLALVRVARPFSAVPAMREWDQSLAPLSGVNLLCMGQGWYDAIGNGGGTWRFAWLRPVNVRTNDYDMYTNTDNGGQIQYKGDSGGPCINYNYSPPYVTSILGGGNGSTFSTSPGLSTFNSAWSKDIRQRSELLFYKKTDGTAYVSSLERNGTYVSTQALSGFSTQWTNVTSLRNGAVLFYDKATGAASIGRLERDGSYSGGTGPLVLPANAAFMVAVGDDMLFFLDSAGVGRTARIDPATFTYTPGVTVSGFSTAFTHVVGTKNGGLFFFNRTAGTGVTATVDANMNYTYRGAVSGFSTAWTYLTAVNQRGLFFYNPANGTGFTAEVDASGFYASHNAVSGIGSGYSVIGASNGTLLFRNASGGAGTAQVNDAGVYTPISSLTGFSTAWTHAALE